MHTSGRPITSPFIYHFSSVCDCQMTLLEHWPISCGIIDLALIVFNMEVTANDLSYVKLALLVFLGPSQRCDRVRFLIYKLAGYSTWTHCCGGENEAVNISIQKKVRLSLCWPHVVCCRHPRWETVAQLRILRKQHSLIMDSPDSFEWRRA